MAINLHLLNFTHPVSRTPNEFGKTGAVSYKGHTSASLRSVKHDAFDAFSHGLDLMNDTISEKIK